MKSFFVICLFAVVATVFARPGEEHYTDRYDTVNLDEILGNKRLLEPYVNCLLERGKCTAEGRELKEHVREALESECAKCTEVQKNGTRRVIGHLINHEDEFWQELSQKYDPNHKFTKKYEDELRKIKA